MKNILSTDKAPAAIGPYSQAIRVGDMLLTSGQIPLDPTTMKVVEGGIEAQTERVLDNLEAILTNAGLTFADVIKTTIFIVDMSEFGTVNGIYSKRFATNPPARSCVQVAALPLGVRVEIECIAHFS